MFRRQGLLQGKTVPGALALLVLCLAGPLASSARAENGPALNGPGGPDGAGGGRVALGDLAASSPEGCSLAFTVQVLSEVGTGNDTFELQVLDDGAIVWIEPLSAPADGAVHQLSGSIRLNRPVSQQIPGVGVYLVDSGVILDAVDPLQMGCGAVEIPTLGTAGAWLLGGLLLLSALVVLRRPRLSV